MSTPITERNEFIVTMSQLQRSTAHPPCPQEQEVLEISVPRDRAELRLSDRLSLRIGLWLLLRAERTRSRRSERRSIDVASHFPGAPQLSQREAIALLTYDMQRHML
jgi:hypothetical protein